MEAKNGNPSYTCSVSSGSLPTGLSLDSGTGGISGTPTTIETQNFTIKVTDATNSTEKKDFSITVNSKFVIAQDGKFYLRGNPGIRLDLIIGRITV